MFENTPVSKSNGIVPFQCSLSGSIKLLLLKYLEHNILSITQLCDKSIQISISWHQVPSIRPPNQLCCFQ